MFKYAWQTVCDGTQNPKVTDSETFFWYQDWFRDFFRYQFFGYQFRYHQKKLQLPGTVTYTVPIPIINL